MSMFIAIYFLMLFQHFKVFCCCWV